VEDGHSTFSLIMDYFQALLNRREAAFVHELSEKLVSLRPHSVHARLCLAMAIEQRADGSDGAADQFIELAEDAYSEAMRLGPDAARVHAGTGIFS
jgi:hypothetical protein